VRSTRFSAPVPLPPHHTHPWGLVSPSQYRLAAEAAAPAQLTRTLAPPRPAAYVPEDDALPLPRPYGAHRPFRAIPPSATMMKYVRRPPLPLSASS